MKLLFFGSRLHGFEALKAIIAHGHTVSCVTTEDYQMDEISSNDFKKVCDENGIDFHKTDRVENDEMAAKYAEYKADLGVCVGWRKIIREKVLTTTKQGFIGPHGADLPKYRGFASTHNSILNGDPYCGFCIMKFKPGKADNGSICSRFKIELDETSTIRDIMERSRPIMIRHLIETIDKTQNGSLELEEQDESKVIYSYPRLPEDGEIDWNKSVQGIDRLIRAVTRPYPGAFTFFNNEKMFIWEAHVFKGKHEFVGVPGHVIQIDGQVGVLTGEGILILDECQFETGKSFVPSSFFKTHRLRLGANYSKHIYELEQRVEKLEKLLDNFQIRS